MTDTAQIIELNHRGRRHWFRVWRYETTAQLHAALAKDNIAGFDKLTDATTVVYADGEECGRMYLLDKSIRALSHEATHMAVGIMRRHGMKSLTFEPGPVSEEEETMCILAGKITSELYSKSKFY